MYSDPLFIRTLDEMIDETINNSRTTPEQTLDLILFNTTTIAREVQRTNKDTKEAAFRYLENEITNLKTCQTASLTMTLHWSQTSNPMKPSILK